MCWGAQVDAAIIRDMRPKVPPSAPQFRRKKQIYIIHMSGTQHKSARFPSLDESDDFAHPGASFMENARFFRGQAAMCLQIAGQTSDPERAEAFLVAATRYFAHAIALEKRTELAGIQAQIGEALRTLFAVTEPSPERLLELVRVLDQPIDVEKQNKSGWC
jgi:hypothetical protein